MAGRHAEKQEAGDKGGRGGEGQGGHTEKLQADSRERHPRRSAEHGTFTVDAGKGVATFTDGTKYDFRNNKLEAPGSMKLRKEHTPDGDRLVANDRKLATITPPYVVDARGLHITHSDGRKELIAVHTGAVTADSERQERLVRQVHLSGHRAQAPDRAFLREDPRRPVEQPGHIVFQPIFDAEGGPESPRERWDRQTEAKLRATKRRIDHARRGDQE